MPTILSRALRISELLTVLALGGCAAAQTAEIQQASLAAPAPVAQSSPVVAVASPAPGATSTAQTNATGAPATGTAAAFPPTNAKKAHSGKGGMKLPPPKASSMGTLRADGTYELGPDELKLDCKKLTGRVTIRILQMRNNQIRSNSTLASRLSQQAFTPLYGGTQHGADPDSDYRRDLALVQAYNKQLAEKKCKVFDLTKELQPKPAAENPKPIKQ